MSFIFQADGALPANHQAYVLRHDVDNQAFVTALNGQILHTMAPRQIGKTSLLKRLKYRLLEEGWRCVYLDLSRLMNLAPTQWYIELGNLLASELTPEEYPTITNQVELRHYLINISLSWRGRSPRIALLFDEVEAVLKVESDPSSFFSDAFFMTLRNLYNDRDMYNGYLTIALAGAVSPNSLVKDKSISPFNVGQKIGLDDFTQTETRELTEHLLELGLTVEDSTHQTIYEWTSGHPYLTHYICFELEKRVHNHLLLTITSKEVNHVVQQTFLTPTNPLLRDSNIGHVTKMVQSLPEAAQKFWLRLQKREAILMRDLDSNTYLDLYLTGACKAYGEQIAIRNRIYEQVFTVKVLSELEPDKPPLSLEQTAGANNEPLPSYEPPISTALPKTGEQFLEGEELSRIIKLIDYAINGVSEHELQNILEACHIPLGIISHIKYHEGHLSVANELVSKLVRAGALAPQYQCHAFGAFLVYFAEHELVGFDAALEMIVLIFKYHLVLDQARVRELSSLFQIPLPSFADPSYPNGQITLSPLPDRVRAQLAPQVYVRLESLYKRGIRHYVAPQFFIGGHNAINAVCRIEFDKRGIATGFLIAPDLVLTNYHVFRPEGTSYDLHSRAKSFQVRFAAKRDDGGSEEPGKIFKLHKDWLVASSDGYELDYLLLRLERSAKDGVIAPVKQIVADADADAIHKDMFVNIIHHPLGGAMEVSLRCNEVVEVEPQRIYYLADTEEGSSGAPVFDDDWRVVALHSAGGEKDASGRLLKKANVGIPIGLIMKKIAQYLTPGD